MQSRRAFPPNTDLGKATSLYLKSNAIQVTSRQLAGLAATLACGGVCPATQRRVFAAQEVRRVLALLGASGLGDHSGLWAMDVGLPGKASRSGAVLLVVPDKMGICIWSPRVNHQDVSSRGIEVATRLVKAFPLHSLHLSRRNARAGSAGRNTAAAVLFAAAAGDTRELRRALATGHGLLPKAGAPTTALHVAACHGHAETLRFLVDYVKSQCNSVKKFTDTISRRDRCGATPLDVAKSKRHTRCIEILESVSLLYKRL